MNHRQSELKGKLMTVAEAAIEELMNWEAGHPDSEFDEIEALMLKIRQRMGKRMTEVLLEAQTRQRPVPGPTCAECGREMGYKGAKGRSFGSLVGEISSTRGYYYCDHCGSGLFPPG